MKPKPEDLDDISDALEGDLGAETRQWLAHIGRRGGSKRSLRKTKAARLNAKKPRKHYGN